MARIRTAALVNLCRRLGTALDAGLAVPSLFEKEASRSSAGMRWAMSAIHQRIMAGDTLADAFRAQAGFFPPLVCDMVDVGEQTGKTGAVFLQLADHYEHLLKLRRTFLAGILWPMLQLFGGVLIIAGLIYLMGVLAGQDLVGLGLNPCANVCVYFFGIGFVATVIGFPIVAVSRGWLGTTPVAIAYKIPVLGRSLQTMALARMAWALAMANDAGMDARKTMELSLRSAGFYYQAHSRAVDEAILGGSQLTEAIAATGAYPQDFLDALGAGEDTGMVAESMQRLADEYRSKAQSSNGALAVIAGFIVWGLVAALMIAVIFHLFINLYLRPMQEALQPIVLLLVTIRH